MLAVIFCVVPVNAFPLYSFAWSQDSLQTDSLVSDSVKKPKKDPFDAPVYYESTDSMVWSRGGNAYLYGNGKVNYDKIELTASIISMNMDSSVVHAAGSADSTGVVTGIPIFMDGGTPYESDRMTYNFKTRKGFINNVYTQQGDGFLMGGKAKKDSSNVFYSQDGMYTTCDAEHPHFYVKLTRAKVRPQKDVVSGPLYLVVEDVPLPLALPFGYFPFTESFSSGFIMPSYGDELERGFYLRNGGYYFAISDKMDLRLTGEIFTKGSWGVNAASNYAKRYKFSGNVGLSYLVTKTGEKGLPDYAVGKNFRVQWSHRQDAKAMPNTNFSASVNFATSAYERANLNSLYNPALSSQSVRTSSINFSHTFPSIGLSVSATMNLSQSVQDSMLSLTLPTLNISLSKKYPFKTRLLMIADIFKHAYTMIFLAALAKKIDRTDDSEETIRLLTKMYYMSSKTFGEYDSSVLSSLTNLAYVYRNNKNYDKAIEYGRMAYEASVQISGRNHKDSLEILLALASDYYSSGDILTARQLYKNLYDSYVDHFGEEHKDTIAIKTKLDEIK